MSEDISEKQEKTTVVEAPAETTPTTGEVVIAAPKTKRKRNNAVANERFKKNM